MLLMNSRIDPQYYMFHFHVTNTSQIRYTEYEFLYVIVK